MNRKDFLKTGSLLGAALVLPTTDAFSKNMADNSIDKLVDANGNYIQQNLPYNENFLEPYMDIWMLKPFIYIILFIMVVL